MRAFEPLERARRHRHGRESRRAAQALLRATVGDVDAVLVHQHGHAAQRRDAIGDHQRAGLVRRFADGLGLVEHAGGRLGLHEGHHVRLFAADEVAGLLRVVRLAPGLGEAHYFGALAASHFADAVAEEAVGEQRELPAGLGEIGDGGFHSGAAGPGDRQVELVLRGENVAEQRADLAGNFKEERIEVAHHILRHGLVHARRHHAGSGTEEQALGRVERGKRLRHHSPCYPNAGPESRAGPNPEPRASASGPSGRSADRSLASLPGPLAASVVSTK